MVKISEVLIALYRLAVPLCERKKISLNLDLADPTLKISLKAGVLEKRLTPLLEGAIARTRHGSVTVGAYFVSKKTIAVFIRDTGEAIPKTERTQMAERSDVEVHSRHGYGSTITVTVLRA